MRIYQTMCDDVIKRRGLKLRFEHDYENPAPDSSWEGLKLHNHMGDLCGCINIGLRINGNMIECIDME